MNTELTIGMEDIEKKAEHEMTPIMQKAAAFLVNSEETYHVADEIAGEIKRWVNVFKPELEPVKENATKAWKAAVALWKRFVDDPLEAVKTLDRRRYQWKQTEERKRQEAAEALRRAEQKKQEEEHRAEVARIVAEAKRQADEAIALAERLKTAGMPEQAEAVLVSAGAEEEREVERAQEVLVAPMTPVTVPEPVKVEKPEGQSYVENWQAKVVDGTKVPREFLTPDLVALGRYAKLMRGMASVPGVEFEDVGSVRRRL